MKIIVLDIYDIITILWLIIDDNHYRLIAIDLSKQKELDADPKANQETEFVGQLINTNGINPANSNVLKFFLSF